MKTFTKYIIPSILLLGTFIALLICFTRLTDLVNTETTNLVLHDAIQTSIGAYVILVLGLLTLSLYIVNFIIFIYNKDRDKEKFYNTIENIMKEFEKVKNKEVNNNNPKVDILDNLLTLSAFKNHEAYYKYLQENYLTWKKEYHDNSLNTTHYKSSKDFVKWIKLYQEVKPVKDNFINYSDYEDVYNYWYINIPASLQPYLNLTMENKDNVIEFEAKG